MRGLLFAVGNHHTAKEIRAQQEISAGELQTKPARHFIPHTVSYVAVRCKVLI